MENKTNFLPFYAGQKVILNPNLSDHGRYLKHGVTYIISECVSKINPVNGKGPFVYIGIAGICNEAWLSPTLVVPIEEMKASIMTFAQIQEYKPLELFINN